MPVNAGRDSKGCYYQWGSSGKKYYYTCGDKPSRDRAKRKAEEQGRAVRASGYRG
jgi:hypothetical protein